MKNVFFSLLFSAFSLSLSAQSGYMPGFIVKSNGDTLNGLILYKSDKDLSKSCVFKRFDIAEQVTYNASQLKEYGFDYGRHFESMKIGNRRKFMECVAEGDVSLFIEAGDHKGQFYIENKELGFVRFSKGRNNIKGVGDWEDFREMLAYLLPGCPPGEISSTSYKMEPLSDLINKYNQQSDQEALTFNLTPSRHFLGDFSVTKKKPYYALGITGGYQYVIPSINDTKNIYLKGGDYYPSMRPVAGLYISRKAAKFNSPVSITLAALLFKDSYYVYSEYGSVPYTIASDIFLDMTGIQFPFGIKLELSKAQVKPYIKGGLMYTYLIDNLYTRVGEETDHNKHIVTTTVDHYYYARSDPGYYAAFGLDVPLGIARNLGFELMYERDKQHLIHPGENYATRLYGNLFTILMHVNF